MKINKLFLKLENKITQFLIDSMNHEHETDDNDETVIVNNINNI